MSEGGVDDKQGQSSKATHEEELLGLIAQRGRSRNNEASKTKTESNKNCVPARAWFLNLNC
jgi:hypothetical protein